MSEKNEIEAKTMLIGYRPDVEWKKFRILMVLTNDCIIPDLVFSCMVQANVAMFRNCINWERIEAIEQKDFPTLEYSNAFELPN